jgi:hypothetical protein
MLFATRRLLFLLFLFGAALTAAAQSTLASLSGAVHDSTGALIPSAQVTATRAEDGFTRTLVTDGQGAFTFVNLAPGTWSLRAVDAGFAPQQQTGLVLTARQNLRVDLTLSAGASNEVTVNASNEGVIDTADPQIAATLSAKAVLDLPANFRGAGSTSPLNVIQVLPGVQPDSGSFPPQPSSSPNPAIKFSIQGGLPSQSETTVDGISAQNQTSNNILGDAFPSAEAISEIRVDGVNNNAQYGQPGEITTVTKSGTDQPHGSAYWFFQNSGFDAIPYGTNAANKPKKVANDFGASFGGPVLIPHLYNGHNRTFFFADYEGLRYATSRVVQYVLPTALERSGDFSQETATLTNPFTGLPYPGERLTPNASSAALLSLFPAANLHVGEPVAQVLQDPSTPYNYLSTKNNSIDSDQYDIRLDQTFGSRATAFVRYTNKTINQVEPADLALPNGTGFATYRILASSLSYQFTPHITNEFRFGFTLEQDGSSNPFNGAAFTANANLQGLPGAFFNGVPHLGFEYYTSGGERLNSSERSRLFQFTDNLTLQRGSHTIVAGVDVRTLNAFTPLDFAPSDNYGNFYFSQDTSFTGNEFADFLAGVPYLSQVDDVQSDNNGVAQAYAAYVQDTWSATPRLSLTFGLRYELHPAFHSTNGELGNFDPSVPKTGRLIYPDGYANLLNGPELAGFNACAIGTTSGSIANGAGCTPVLSNTQAGLPSGLRTTPELRFEPRLGFVFRPFSNERTAIRGGAGYFNITTSGALFYALTGTLQADLNSYYNSLSPSGPAFAFPSVGNASTLAGPPAPGTGVFYSAVDIHWHDPYSLQTNLSVDQDLGHGFGLRASYVGLTTWHLVWQPELNQLTYNDKTIAALQPRNVFPFPNFGAIYNRATSANANYQSGQVELHHRSQHGYSLDTAYTFAKNLADNQGTYGAASGTSSFVDEQGGYDATYAYNQHIDYGQVIGTRRHRSITNGIYELPIGQGKRFFGSTGRAGNLLLGGWQLSGIFALQSGPAITAYIPSGNADPSGTGSGSLYYRQQRPDRVASGTLPGHTRSNWFNKAAFTCPGGTGLNGTTGFASLQNGNCVVGGFDYSNPANPVPVAPIGRFGTESIGDLTGPGTISLSTGISKAFRVVEGVNLRAQGTFTNVLNHTNLADPTLDVTSPAFGVITQARGSDFGGNRTGQVALRLEF